jgi:hypothetical protein
MYIYLYNTVLTLLTFFAHCWFPSVKIQPSSGERGNPAWQRGRRREPTPGTRHTLNTVMIVRSPSVTSPSKTPGHQITYKQGLFIVRLVMRCRHWSLGLMHSANSRLRSEKLMWCTLSQLYQLSGTFAFNVEDPKGLEHFEPKIQ